MDTIHILVSSDTNYLPMLGVMLHSLAQSRSTNAPYVVHLLCDEHELDRNRLRQLQKQILLYENMSLELVRVDSSTVSRFCLGEGYCSAAYYRLLAPILLQDLERVLYLDCDTLVCCDVSELYNTKLDNCLVAATKEVPMIGRLASPAFNTSEYMGYLGIANAKEYFNSGVLVMNLERLRSEHLVEPMLKYAERHDCRWVDQDVLNYFCQGRVKFIDLAWNGFYELGSDSMTRFAPIDTYRSFLYRLEQTKILHFAGGKPWNDPSVDGAESWWTAARQTSWYEIVFQRYIQQQVRARSEQDMVDSALSCVYKANWLRENLEELRKWNDTHIYAALVDLALKREGKFDEVDANNAKLLKSAPRVIFYGAGYWCRTFLSLFDLLGLNYPSEIWDANAAIIGNRLSGISVRGPDFESLQTGDLMIVTIFNCNASDSVVAKISGNADVLTNADMNAMLAYILLEKKKYGDS